MDGLKARFDVELVRRQAVVRFALRSVAKLSAKQVMQTIKDAGKFH